MKIKFLFSLVVLGFMPLIFSLLSKENPMNEGKNVIQFQTEQYKTILKKLKGNFEEKIKILHIGDSHIQIGGISKGILSVLNSNQINIQSTLFFPTSVFSDFINPDFEIKTKGNWQGITLTNAPEKDKIGFSGRKFMLLDNSGSINIKAKNLNLINQITVYHQDDSLFVEAKNTEIFSEKLNENIFKTTIQYKKNKHEVTLKINQDINNGSAFYGFTINENSKSNNYYNAGVSGVKYLDFFKNDLLFSQIDVLKPNLILLSLGTNDSYFKLLDITSFKNELFNFFKKLKSSHTELIVMSVPDTYYNKEKATHLIFINESLKEICLKNDIPFWDWNEIMGGNSSILKWKELNLVDEDLLHFNNKGYELIGESFAKALIK
jgi:lysophospholipase L1-like esterase